MNRAFLNKRKRQKKSLKRRTSRFNEPTNAEYKKFQEICRKRYKQSHEKYDKFFLDCVEEIEALQPNGFACVQASRFFTLGLLPKYCLIPDPLTKKQRERVERLLAE